MAGLSLAPAMSQCLQIKNGCQFIQLSKSRICGEAPQSAAVTARSVRCRVTRRDTLPPEQACTVQSPISEFILNILHQGGHSISLIMRIHHTGLRYCYTEALNVDMFIES